MSSNFNEDAKVKFPTLMHLVSMGYEYISTKGLPQMGVEKTEYDPLTNILISQFKTAFYKLNPKAHEGDAEKKLSEIQSVLKNEDLGKEFYEKYLMEKGEGRIVDFSSEKAFIKNNTFQVATEMNCGSTNSDHYRPDITLFINGLPLAFIEVKIEDNPGGMKQETERMKARFVNEQNRRYLNMTQIMMFSNDMDYAAYNVEPVQGAFYATIGRRNTKYNCFREEGQKYFHIAQTLKKVTPRQEEIILKDNNKAVYVSSLAYRTNCAANTRTKQMASSLFSFNRFYFLLKFGLVYVDRLTGLEKHIMRYPQIFATKAIEDKLEKGIKKGVIWHTQGSGKTALAYFCVKYLTEYYSKMGVIPQFFFIVDRLDLLQQAEEEFTYRGMKVNSVQTKEDFKNIITSNVTTQNTSGEQEVTVVNIQKFKDDSRATKANDYSLKVQRIYFIDEVHRDYNPTGSFLKNLFLSDPQSVKIGLTGTPVVSSEYKTTDIFGDYIHFYYYNESVADGYTLRLVRENIGSNFKIKMQEVLHSIKVKAGSVKESDVYSRQVYVEPVLDYIIDDLAKFRIQNADPTLGGMVVCNSRKQAELMYRLFLQKYADPSELVKEIDEDGTIIYKSVDPEAIEAKCDMLTKGCYRAALILSVSEEYSTSKTKREKWIKLYKDGKIDLLIVYQMLQTGFDAPRLKKLYLHRVVKDHNLLQTLTRVNRPYKTMQFGHVVDFADIKNEYDKTNKDYKEEIESEVGDEHSVGYSKLFVGLEEAKKLFDESVENLKNYDLDNPQIFNRQLDLVEDLEQIKTLLKSLENIRDLKNMLLAQGSEVTFINELLDISSLVKAARHRLDFLRLKNNTEEQENVQQLLNMALENIEFSFYKKSEEELELKEQYQEALASTRKQLSQNIDMDDPRYHSLLEEFLRLFRNKDMDSASEFNLHGRFQNLNEILKKIKTINEEDAIIALKYNNDQKYARIEKRIKEKEKSEEDLGHVENQFSWSKDKQKLNKVLFLIKQSADDSFFRNQSLIDNPAFFINHIVTIVTSNFRDEQIKSDRETRRYIGTIISKEYQKEYTQC